MRKKDIFLLKLFTILINTQHFTNAQHIIRTRN